MKTSLIIAKNTFLEIIRDRVLYGIVVFAILLMGVSIVLGQLSFQEQARISLNFGFTGIHISAIALAIFVGSSLVYKEIEKQTILTLLARPITRSQFLVGKFLGLAEVIFVIMFGLALTLAVVALGIGVNLTSAFPVALIGIGMEALVILSISLFFGTFSRPIMTVVFTIGIFLIGHGLESLKFFAEKSESGAFRLFSELISYVAPNLELFNWRSHPVYEDMIASKDFLIAFAHCFGWVVLLLFLTSVIFSRRDFV